MGEDDGYEEGGVEGGNGFGEGAEGVQGGERGEAERRR